MGEVPWYTLAVISRLMSAMGQILLFEAFLPKKPLYISAIAVTLLLAASPLHAQEAASDALDLFSAGEEEVVSTSRIPRPISRIAENVTVVTAEDIRRLNAHTLSEVLNTIPGIQMQWPNRTPGSDSDTFLQGAEAGLGHVLVLLDGVQQNNYNQGWADIAKIPVQQIERVEIIKGAASTSWGPALGGVINVITKSPAPNRASGEVSASIGERSTSDTRGEISGTIGNTGYYLSAGNLHSAGLRPNNGITENNGSLKLTYDLPVKGSITYGVTLWENSDGDQGVWDNSGWLVHDDLKNRFGSTFLTLKLPVGERLSLEITGRSTYREVRTEWNDIISDEISPFIHSTLRDNAYGGGAKLSWGDNDLGFVAGIDYDHANVRTHWLDYSFAPPEPGQINRNIDRLGAYLNGLWSIGRLTLLPGIRYDRAFGANNISGTAGATLELTDRTVLRAYGAQGYGLPNLAYGKDLQKVWTVQTGVETTEVPYLWLKGTLFYNRLRDAQESALQSPERRQTKQGFEVEARTVPLYGLSVGGGYTLNDSRDAEHTRHESKPAHIGKLNLFYDNDRLDFTGTLTGSYVWWNSSAWKLGNYDRLLWDLHLAKKIHVSETLTPEIFFSVRNLFNGSQYEHILYKNASRWVEGGVRFSF